MSSVGVAAPNKEATDAALAMAEAGGGAVDAAVAAMLVAMVSEPGIVSLDGGAFVTVWPAGPDAVAVTVDGCVAMPGLGRPADAPALDVREVSTGYGGGVAMTIGVGSVATPGALAALDLAQQRYGRLPWREVVSPAEATSRHGFLLGAAAGAYLPFVRESVYAWDARTAATLHHPDGSWRLTNDRVVIDGLADTLGLIAEHGTKTLYDGELAEAITADMGRRGGSLTRQDLSSYRPVVRPALAVTHGDWQLRTNPPPAIGGPVLAALLTLLGDRPRGAWTADDVAHLVHVQRTVLGYRREHLDTALDREAAGLALLDRVGGQRSPSTVHVSVVDSEGAACSITASSGYGSGATVPGTGLWLNNCLGEHELNRGEVRRPGERLASNMAPTVGRAADGSALAIGSPGADRITTALAQVLAAFTTGGAALQEAIDRPRLHVHHLDGGDPPARVEAEEDMPLPDLDLPVRRHERHAMYFGGVAAAHIGAAGDITAAGDPRRAGAVAVS